MKIDLEALRVREDEKLSLARRPTTVDPIYPTKADYDEAMTRHARRLAALHERLFARASHALLVILQGMDCAGKDGAIKHVMSGINPQGCRVVAFKTPTPLEARHDFLWRSVIEAPVRGSIAVFNRSYYEAVLIERVHPELLATEGLDVAPRDRDALWDERLHSIRAYERHLTASGTRIVKVFLHISKDEQTRRLIARVEDPEKSWKITPADVEERKYWKDYQRAYEHAMSATSTADAPWNVVPADDKRTARLIVSELVGRAMDGLPLSTPPVGADRARELREIRDSLGPTPAPGFTQR